MLTLYYYPSNASLAPHILLEEFGVPYELMLVDRDAKQHKSPEYLKMNPTGLIPVLVDGDLVLPETAAIMLHLADTHPAAGFMPPLGTAARAETYRWLVYLTNTVQAELIHYYYPDRLGGPHVELIQQNAVARLMSMFDILDAQFAKSGGPFITGNAYTIADIFLFMMCRWTRNMPKPASTRPHLKSFLDRMAARPAVIRAHAQENLTKPWY